MSATTSTTLRKLKLTLRRLSTSIQNLKSRSGARQEMLEDILSDLDTLKECNNLVAYSPKSVNLLSFLRILRNASLSLQNTTDRVTIEMVSEYRAVSSQALTSAVALVNTFGVNDELQLEDTPEEASSEEEDYVEEVTSSPEDELIEEDMTCFTSFASSMPNKKTTDSYKLYRLPIVVCFNRFIPSYVFEGSGLKIKDMGGYTVLQDSNILALNVAKISEELEVDNMEDFLNKFLKQLSIKDGREWLPVIDEPLPFKGSPGWHFYWIETSSHIDHLLSFGGSKTIEEWGFAF